ncbi:helix-turn-helix transcriptional regulator [Paenibacillus marinisediminis]
MKRGDRLTAIVMALQQRAETAASLAAKLEVSKRTIMRDMQALSEMGVPLYAVSGPSGGYRLMEGYKLPPLGLTEAEALTVLVALDGMTRLADTPFNTERWTVIDKVRHGLSPDLQLQLEPLLSKLELSIPARRYRTPHLMQMLEAAAEGRALRVRYRSQRHERSLLLLPERLHSAHGFWYCEAYSPEHGEVRTFRVDRCDAVEGASGPDEDRVKSEAAHWRDEQRLQAASGAGRAAPEGIHIRARLNYRGMLRVEQDEHIGESLCQLSDELWEADFELPASEYEWVVRFMYGLGTDAEVLEPAALREAVRDMARRVVEQYSNESDTKH